MFAQLFRRFTKSSSGRIQFQPGARSAEAKRKIARAVCSALETLEDRTLYSFSVPVSYPAAAAPVAMISADLNNDGRPDLLTSNSTPPSVTALLGNGDGTFSSPLTSTLGANTPTSQYTGSQAGTLVSADFNGDGRIDAATVSGNNAVILFGNGDGTFQAPTVTYLGSSPARITAADLNGDSRADLIAANTNGTVTVLLGNGAGAFAAPSAYAAGPSAQDVKVADINHDGKPDLVVANAVSAGSVSTLMGNGDGTFQPYHSYSAFSAPYQLQLADVNSDGNEDVVVANSYTSSCVTVLLGNPDGSYQPYQSYNTGFQPWELEAADVNGDGKPDLVDSNGSSYQVELNNGDGTFGVPSTITGAGLAFAMDDFNGDGSADIAGATGPSVGVMINDTPAAINVSAAVAFQITAPAATVAGASLPLTISAVDSGGNVVADFRGTVHFTTTDPRFSGLTYTLTAADGGTHTFPTGLALFTAGPQAITVTGPASLTGSATLTVTAAAASRFSVSALATSIAGTSAPFTVTAQDAFGNLAADYTGTIHFTSNDLLAGLPADYAFAGADAGVQSFSAVLKTAGSITITATDTAQSTAVGSASVVVTPTAAVSLGLVGGGGHIGSQHTVTVTAYDEFGNVATGYNGAVHLSASDPNAQLPADSALTNGVGNFPVIPMTLGAQTLTATDTSNAGLTGTESITGTPGYAATFVVTPISGGVAGTAQTVTVTAYDAFGNVAVDYSGAVYFSSSDPQAGLPGYYAFTAADAGTHSFSVTLRTAGSQSLTVRDYYDPTINATQGGIVITSAAPATLSTTLLHGVTAGTAQSITVSVRDVYGNLAAGYRGTLNFASSDTQAGFPASYTFGAADAGTHTFVVTLKSSGGQTFTVQDSANAAMSSFQRDIQVTPAAVAGFAFRTPSNASAGTAFTATLSAVDAYGNTVTGYTGKVHFTGPSGGGNLLPADYTFTNADAGTHVFSITLGSTGTQTVSVADTVTGSLRGSFSIAVKSGTVSSGGGGGGSGKKIV
ncbi:MAG: hypothetical protein JWM97_1094 [Phycisphaerales bacterium]|nr:hypothetical protein [Phycisphaerales bacterium]